LKKLQTKFGDNKDLYFKIASGRNSGAVILENESAG